MTWPLEDLVRDLAPRVLGTLVRRYGDFARCEDAVQEALIDAAASWSRDGVPDHPLGWLITVATRRYVDMVRSEVARETRERRLFEAVPPEDLISAPADSEPVRDDLLELLFLCCHPALTAPSQMALTLRAVAGLTTSEIAAAFLVPDKTMGQRISRAKQRLREVGARFELPPDQERGQALGVVLHVLYLLFNEGYSASAGHQLHRPDLTATAIRLTRRLHERMPDPSTSSGAGGPSTSSGSGPTSSGAGPTSSGTGGPSTGSGAGPTSSGSGPTSSGTEGPSTGSGNGATTGLLALMLLTEARSAARTGAGGILVPLAEQDRSLWDRAAIAEGTDLATRSLMTPPVGPYQVQAAIAAVHSEASSVDETDWPQILALYELLERLAPNPVTMLNRAVALGEVRGPRAALELIAELEQGPLAGHHRLFAVRAHLLEKAGDPTAASEAFREAARLAGSVPEQRFLRLRAARCASAARGPGIERTNSQIFGRLM